MPSMLPILSYSVLSEDNDFSPLASPSSHGSTGTFPKSSTKKDTRSLGKAAEGGRKSESSRDGKKSGKKKKRPTKKVASRHGAVDDNKVEELVAKATARAEAVQTVKKAILDIQLFLLDGVQDMAQLQATNRLLTQSEYSDIVTERSISKQCGYPLCYNGLITEPSRKGRYRISLHEHKVYDLSETRLFCCANCLVASKTFQSSLQIDRDGFMKKEKLMSIMDYIRDPKASRPHPSNGNPKDPQNHSVPSNQSLVSGIQEREDSGISSFDDAGPFDAIDGYVPQNWPSNKIGTQTENRDQLEWGADLERMSISDGPNLSPTSKPVSLDKGKSPLILDELDVEISPAPLLKSALKKGASQKILKRNVSWEDQKRKDQRSETKDQRSSSRLKERLRVPTPISHGEPTSASEIPTSKETPIAGDSASVSSDVEKMEGSINPAIDHRSVCSFSRDNNVDIGDDPELPAEDSQTQKSERVLSAEAVAAALTQAAEAAAGGEIGSEEAVAQAGLSIVPVTEDVEVSQPGNTPDSSLEDSEEKRASDTRPSTEIDVKWPMPEAPEEDYVDFTSAKGAWHSTPPKNFKVEVSMFGTIWMALEEWISAATIAHIYGKEPQDEDEFVVANGREFRRQRHVADSTSAEISRTFSNCISRAFPDVVQALRLNVPISILEQNIGRLVRTMTFVEALPAFSIKHWSMILLLLLDGLSVQRVPSIGAQLTNNMALLRKFLDSTGTSEAEYDTFRGLLLPLGRLPTFATMSGG
ncbi:unnamed protein product [Calypogeia fissa]